MSFYDTADAIYGIGEYGAASYGVVTPNVSLTGVDPFSGKKIKAMNLEYKVDF